MLFLDMKHQNAYFSFVCRRRVPIRGAQVGLFPPVPAPVQLFIVHKYRHFDVGRPRAVSSAMAMLVYKSDVPGHLYYSGSNISTQRRRLCLGCRRRELSGRESRGTLSSRLSKPRIHPPPRVTVGTTSSRNTSVT